MSMGIIGQKAGMTRIFDSTGISVPVTAISVSPTQITQIKTLEKDGYKAVQVSYGQKKESKVNKAVLGHYKKAAVSPGKGLMEFRLNDKEMEGLEIGKSIDLSLFKVGEHVDITGTTLGKGFQGGVKRHHFATQDATHGNSLSHRAHGATGQCQDPGRVFKGKKMAGQLGNVRNTIQNLVIVKILLDDNTILVKGSIPGHDGSNVIIKPTRKKYTPREILTIEETVVEEVEAAAPSKESKPAENVKTEEGTKE
ncbi:MAG: 50S ribosomal protein L3 [Gammaproteobacteria bacterium]|nr:50S ribosomal protein L3 [Gammaproteobacteria bacterium]